jgi:SHS2 domain-containing protein
MPFEELSHTADWSLRVWAADLAHLFVETARGMNALAGTKLAEKPRVRRTFSISAVDTECLLVAFLSELVYYAEQEKLGFDMFKINVEGQTLKVEMEGAPIVSMNKAIKAVTYHNLQVRQTARGYEVEIVFDV